MALPYRGRFAPSPSGPLHFGSLVAAIGSYLDAKHQHGKWLVRIEDLDTPRTVTGAVDSILRTLEAYRLEWDEPVVYQSERSAFYQAAFDHLHAEQLIYPCACTRKEIADSTFQYGRELIYPGTCRNGLTSGKNIRAWRIRVNNAQIKFTDRVHGAVTQDLTAETGDFVIKRADSLFAYQLAVVADDYEQEISHVVRGADLLLSTPRQIYLQQCLQLTTPIYMHLPVVLNTDGEKLSKQTHAQSVEASKTVETFFAALTFLQQQPPVELRYDSVEQIRTWAIENWRPDSLFGLSSQSISALTL